RWVGEKGQAIRDESGGVVSLDGAISDITERKRLEQERDRIELELRMAQKLESVGQLAAGIAHEINTPVQFVGDSVHFLKSAFDDYRALLHRYRETCFTLCSDHGAVEQVLGAIHAEGELPYLEAQIPRAF